MRWGNGTSVVSSCKSCRDRANHPAQWLVTVSDGLQEAVHAETIQFNMYHQTCVVIVVVRKLAYDFKI